jgi:hypothetical protein
MTLPSILGITQNETHKMDASSQTRKGASSQESLNDKNDICLRGLFKIPPFASRPAGGTHTWREKRLEMALIQISVPARENYSHKRFLHIDARPMASFAFLPGALCFFI